MSEFERRIDEKRETVERSETLSTQILGHEVILRKSENYTDLSIYKIENGDPLRLGIIKCQPKSVKALEEFSVIASELFGAIAKELRASGEDDLRGESERRHDDWNAEMERQHAVWLK